MTLSEPPEPFEWEQRDAGTLICTECGDTVQAVVCDLHRCDHGGR